MRKIRFIASRATFVAAALVTAAALMLAACSNVLSPPREEAQAAIPAGFGTVRVSAGIQDAARTAMPAAPTGFDHYEYWFAKGEAAAAQKTADAEGKFYLEPGSYTVLVKGFATTEAGSLAGQGTSASFTVSAGADAGTVSVTLSPIDSDGDGTLSYTLKYPEGVTVATYSITVLAGADPIDLADGVTPATEGGVTTLSGSKTVGAGYYYLQVSLERADGAVAGKAEVVYIYRGLTTETAVAEYTFTDGEFITPGTVNTTVDTDENNVGSLRWAIARNNGLTSGGTIIIDLPAGSVITLNSPLPQITKALVLEGNGLTLTRKQDGWTSSATSSLLYPASGTALTVRRVHFKDGLATYGAAISTSGSLRLESCIFSGNRGTDSAFTAGVISSSNSVTVLGCTFYNNSTAGKCSAISASYILMAGNLFYGNTSAFSSPIAYSGTTTAGSYGYNVSDRAGGSPNDYNAAHSGWVFQATDARVTSLSVVPGTFKVSAGSVAATKLSAIPTVSGGYPTKDFYGNPIVAGGAAGAVQATVSNYFVDLLVNNNDAGSAVISQGADAEGLYPANITLTASPVAPYIFDYWLVNNVKTSSSATLNLPLTSHSYIKAIFVREVNVTDLSDGAGSEGAPTLRFALTNAADGDSIRFPGTTAGVSTITVNTPLPEITKSITIEGNGLILTRNQDSWTSSDTSQLLSISEADAEVTISRVHFKGGKSTTGAAIKNLGTLTVESCIFSGNETTANGSAIYNNTSTATIKGSTFYNNTARSLGGVIYHDVSGGLTLTGNLFYGNTRIVTKNSGVTVTSGGSNVTDTANGTGSTQSGWDFVSGDAQITTLSFTPTTFKVSPGSAVLTKLPAELPPGYPAADYYGAAITAGGAAGAVQAAASGYYVEASANNADLGSVTVTPSPNGDGLYPAGVTITAEPASGSVFNYWLVNGEKHSEASTTLNLTLTSGVFVQAVFYHLVVITDTSGTATTAGTLRYAITNAADGDVIRMSAANQTITLTTALPDITKSVTIEGNGLTLTASGTTINLLVLYPSGAVVNISGVYFKGGKMGLRNGSNVTNAGIVNLESCIFSGQNTSSSGGAITIGGGTTTITGCTFYKSSTYGRGGAIYLEGNAGNSLTLTGNLFYGNTASNSAYQQVLYKSTLETTITSSYNVVDKDYGAGTAQAGWVAGTGDTTFSALGISVDPFNATSIKPFSDYFAALQIVPTATEGFPATDFGGATRSATVSSGKTAAGAWSTGEPVVVVEVTSTADTDTTGTLRYAITHAADNDKIVIQSGLGAITLTATLTLTQSVTIEGNGVTVSGNDTCKILTIGSSSVNPTVTIRGVRFDQGKDTNYAGGIRNYGITTLESCIFSNNSVTSSSGQGGAIQNDKTLTVRGCTFYKNSVPAGSYYGGAAIYQASSSAVLTITGNLFYGNTNNDNPVIYNDGTVTSGGYNVSDKAGGTFTAASGWAFVTGDTLFSTLSISSDPFNATSIKPLSAKLSALQIVPTATAGFPATDFSGAARTVVSGNTAAGAWSTAE